MGPRKKYPADITTRGFGSRAADLLPGAVFAPPPTLLRGNARQKYPADTTTPGRGALQHPQPQRRVPDFAEEEEEEEFRGQSGGELQADHQGK